MNGLDEITDREALSDLAFELGVGFGDENTTARQYKERIDLGINLLTQPLIDRIQILEEALRTEKGIHDYAKTLLKAGAKDVQELRDTLESLRNEIQTKDETTLD